MTTAGRGQTVIRPPATSATTGRRAGSWAGSRSTSS